MKVLITGCLGYIGSMLTKMMLDQNCEVLGVDKFLHGNRDPLLHLLNYPNFTFARKCATDINHEMETFRPDVVIPLAAYVGAPLCEKYPKNAKEVNHIQICNIAEKLSPSQRIIYPNTNSGYGIKEGVCVETDPLSPISHYGITKCDAEDVVLAHKNSVVLRLATVFGVSPRMRFDLMVNDFVQRAVFEGEITVFEGHFKRNFVHVRDVCRAFLHSIDPKLSGVYNCVDENENCTKKELALKIGYWIGCSVFDGNGIDPDKRDCNVSSAKLRSTGFQFKTSLRDGVLEVAKLCHYMGKDYIGKCRNTLI